MNRADQRSSVPDFSQHASTSGMVEPRGLNARGVLRRRMNTNVVIVTHNSAATIEACIAPLRSAGARPIVVDTGSSDNTRDIVKTQPIAHLGELPHNPGFAAACNAGATHGNSPFLFFLNPDAVVPAGILHALEARFAADPTIGIIGCLLVDEANRPETFSYGRTVTPFSLLGRHLRPAGVPAVVSDTGWVSGGALAIRRAAWEEVRGFDEQFFMYWEDVDLCRRVRNAGWRVVLDPALRVTHSRGGSRLSAPQKARLYDQSADKYFRKHYSALIWKSHQFLRRLRRISGSAPW